MAAQQDFWGQFEVVEYDKPQYDWGQFEQVPQNKHALETSLKELPENDPYVKTQKHQTEQLANMLFTAEERKAIENKGEIGWWEYAKNYADLSEAVPFYGTGKQIAQTSKVYSIAKKLENGEEVTAADKSYMQDYLKKYTETQLRGTSWGAKGASMLIQAPAFIGEFIATAGVGATAGKGAVIAGIKGAGAAATKAAIKAGTKVATSKALSTIAGEQAVKTIGTKAALETSAKLAGKAATQQAVLVPMYAVQNYNEKKIADGLNLTDKGSDVLYNTQKADSSASWAKSFGIGEIEILSEMSGGLLGYMAGGVTKGITTAATKIGGKVATTNAARGISAVSAKVYNSIPKEARIKLEAAARLTDKLGKKLNTVSEKLKQPSIGFHGVAEEMGEERLGDVLKYAFDLDDNEGYSLDQLGHAIFPGFQQLFLEAGVFSIVGGGSFATRTVINNLKEKGYSDKEATTISQNLSEIEKENMANEILGEVKINEDIKEQEVIKEQVKIENAMLKGSISITENAQENTTEKQKPKTLSDYKKDILSNKFDEGKIDTIKHKYNGRVINQVFKSEDNDFRYTNREFNKIINDIYKNPSIIDNKEEYDNLETQLESVVNSLPYNDKEEVVYPYYEKFYSAINSAGEYLEAKKKKSKAAELYDIEDTKLFSKDKYEIAENEDYKQLNPVLQKRLPNYSSIEEFNRDYSIVENLTKNGAEINSDGTVTLYHAGNVKDILKDGRFIANTAAKGGMTGYNSKSVFFGFNKDYVKKWSSNGTREIIEIKVPLEYIKQAAQNQNEVYLDGDVVLTDKENNIWTPQDEIQDNFYTQLPALKAKTKLNELFNNFNNRKRSINSIQKSETYKNLPENLKNAIDFVFTEKPVSNLTGKEFQKDGVKLTDKVTEYYNENYPNGVNNEILGNVKLDKEGVKDSLGHKIGKLKAAAYKAVPDVIKSGYIYNQEKNWKDRGYDTAVLIAPIKIGNDLYSCEVIVKQGKERQGFYLHEVEITNKLADVFKTANGSTPTSSKSIIAKKIRDLNPSVKNNELYDISDEAPKKTEAPITQEAETVEDELEVPETVADKIIRGESKFGKLYTEWVDRYTPIENLVKKAEQKTGEKLDTSSNPYFQARMYAGLVESIKEQVNDKTFIKKDGKIKITGEGFLPIINDYVEQVKEIEPNYDNAIEDLSDYLIANRYLLDLKDRDGYEATEEQKLKAVSDMTKLNLKYGDKIEDISKIADRIYAFNQRILHNLVDSGNMSQETYDKIIEQNPHHISYKRVMDDNGIGQDFFAKPKFTDAKSPIKKIRGSERDIQNIFVSTLEDVSRILDTAERNNVARSVANLKDILPEYIEERKPAMEKRTAKVKVTYDAKMRSQLEEAIKFFGRTFKNVKSIKTPQGYALGSYSEEEKEVRKKLGSQDRTLAHEVGHMLDFALDVENQIKNDSKIMQELKTLAEDRFKSTVKLQDGEFITEDAGSSEKYKKYVQSNKEAIANAFDLYFTSRDYVKRVAPETAKFIDNLFKGEYAFLNEIRPSSETATEEIEQDVWTPSRNKPYGNVIQYFENGKPKFVEVTKPVMDAVEGMNSQEIDFINKFMVGSASMLRTGATITPEFAIRNFIRDQESAVIYIKNYNPFIDGIKGLFNVLGKKITGKNEAYDEWVKAGGAFGSYMELNEKSVNKALKEFVGEGSKMRSMFSYANPLKLAEEFSSIFEQATRLAMYTRSKMNGSDAMQAALEAREGTLDFGRSGSLGRKFNRVLPFFNAGIQGVDKMVRTFRDHPYLSTMKAVGTITLPQLALTGYYLYFAPDDDREEYLNIPQYQKDFFYCFKVGKNWVRIPKDFTLGYMFGSVPERFLTWAYQNKKPEGKDLAEMAMTLFGSVSPVNNPTDALPPIFRTAVEDIANYSFFRNQHLYPEYMNSLEPSLRANKFNSETSKLLGEKLNISPAKIDHTINSLLGTSGRYLTDAGDLMINSVREFNGEETPEKVKTLADAPFLRGFVLRDPVGYQAVSTNEFFENYKTVSEKHATYNKYKKTDREKARKYKEEHSAELKAYKKMNDTKKRISEIGKQMDKIYSDKTMTSKEKQEKLQPLAKRISDMAFDANVWYGNTKE